ncbi:MAG: hypothetical protein CL917_09815 [Deltaproteobacteria bacterium]|nr:hypothetical protein [Deltaproteobacteria bacterium]
MTSSQSLNNNMLIDCHKLHGELLNRENGTVWQTHGPISREEYLALELPENMVKVGVGVGMMDQHFFRRSPGAEVDGPVAEFEISGHLFIHCANPPKGGPETPIENGPKLLRVDKHHSLIFDAGSDVFSVRDQEGQDFVQVIQASPEGGGILQPSGNAQSGLDTLLPEGWLLRSKKVESKTTIHLPNPTQAWFFANGASFQGPVDPF